MSNIKNRILEALRKDETIEVLHVLDDALSEIQRLERLLKQSELNRVAALTDRQKDVAKLMSTGAPNKAIARDLGMSIGTVKIHASHVLRAYGARSRAEVAARANGYGMAAAGGPSTPAV